MLYTIASVLCAFSGNVYQLIIFRVFQAIASGAATSVAQAVVKDCYTGKKRISVLAVVSSMTMISPIVAPVVGAVILRFTSWRGVFSTLAVIGFLITMAGIAFQETIAEHYTGGILQSLGRLQVVAKNPGFVSLLLTFSLMGIPMMSFITSSSYIYIDQFGLSAQVYSYYFAFNAIFMVIGPLLYSRVARYLKRDFIISASYFISFVSGLLVSFIGSMSPAVFALTLLPATLAGSLTRPPSANLMLEQQKGDTGAAVSLMSCAFTVFGSIGMILISLNWANRIEVMGLLYAILALISLGLWSIISKKPFVQAVES